MRRWLWLSLVALVTLTAITTDAQETPRFRARISTTTVPSPAAGSTITELLAEGSTSNLSTYTSSGTLSCALNALCLCASAHNDEAGGADTPTLTGGGQTTWTLVDSADYHTNQYGIHVFRSLGEAGTAAAMVADFAGDAQGGNIFHCWQITGVDTSGTNGSGAVVQADDNSTAAGTTIAPDGLVALGSPNLMWQIAANVIGGKTWTRDTNFLPGTDVDIATPGVQARVQYLANGTDTTPTMTMDGTANAMATVAVEVKITGAGAGGGGSPVVSIETPTAQPTYQVPAAALTIGGTAADNGSYTLAWACPQCVTTADTPTGTDTWTAAITLTCSTSPGTNNVITVTATDTASQTGSDVITVLCLTPDLVAPEAIITSPVAETTYSTSTQAISLSGTATDAVGVSSCTVSCATCTPTSRTTTVTGTTNATWQTTSSINLASGSNTVQVSCQDAATNAGTDTLTATFTSSDATAPVVTITTNSGSNFTASTLPQTIAGTCTDAVGCTLVTVSCTNASPSAPTVAGAPSYANWSFSLNGITSGNAAVCTVTGRDQAGNNTGTAIDTITVTYIADLQIQTTTLSALVQNQAGQSRCVTASGGVPPYTWSISAGALPTGMALDGSTTVTECFDGTPTAVQTVNPTFSIVDSQGTPDSDTQAISVTVSAPGATGPHTYYDTLKALPEVYNVLDCSSQVPGDNGACSLRNQAQILRLSNGSATTGDTQNSQISAGTDYATITIPTDVVKILGGFGGNQLYAHHGNITSGDVLYVWDARYLPSLLRTSCSGGNNTLGVYKMWQTLAEGGEIYLEIKSNFTTNLSDCSEVFSIGLRTYASGFCAGCHPAGITTTADDYYQPTGQGAPVKLGYKVKVNKWTRFVVLVKANVPASSSVFDPWESASGVTLTPSTDPDGDGSWNAYYLWVCDEDRACERVIYGVPWVNEKNSGTNATQTKAPSGWNLEWDSSADVRIGGPMVGHARNLVILRNYTMNLSSTTSAQDVSNNPTIFVKPVPE